MVAVTALVLFFVVLGLAVVAAGFSGGRGGRPAGSSRGANRAVYIGVTIVVLALGIGVPVLVMTNNADEAESKAVGGVDLTNAQAHGRELFAASCANCHALRASNSAGRIGPDLDVKLVGVPEETRQAFVRDAVIKGRAQGNGNMPAGLFTGEDAKDVAAYVAAVAGR
jgi:mono/diheme cytochrome c family protein